jgi:hypothetical protein
MELRGFHKSSPEDERGIGVIVICPACSQDAPYIEVGSCGDSARFETRENMSVVASIVWQFLFLPLDGAKIPDGWEKEDQIMWYHSCASFAVSHPGKADGYYLMLRDDRAEWQNMGVTEERGWSCLAYLVEVMEQ